MLVRVVAVQVVVLSYVVAYVNRPLIYIDGRCGRADEAGRAGRARRVRTRNQIEQLYGRGVSGGCALRVAQNVRVERKSLPLPQAFVREEEEGPVLAVVGDVAPTLAEARQIDWTAKVEAELVATKRRLRRVEEVPCVQRVVAQELEAFAVKLIRARACHNRNLRTRCAAKFWGKCRCLDTKFLERIHGNYTVRTT